MARGIKIPWVGGRYAMGRKLDKPWIGVFKCHGYGSQNTRSRGVNISWVGGSIYHG